MQKEDEIRDFQGRNRSVPIRIGHHIFRSFKNLHVRYASETYITRIGLGIIYFLLDTAKRVGT